MVLIVTSCEFPGLLLIPIYDKNSKSTFLSSTVGATNFTTSYKMIGNTLELWTLTGHGLPIATLALCSLIRHFSLPVPNPLQLYIGSENKKRALYLISLQSYKSVH